MKPRLKAALIFAFASYSSLLAKRQRPSAIIRAVTADFPIAVSRMLVIHCLNTFFLVSEYPMSNDKKRRYGFIGGGIIGQTHIRSLAFVEGADLVVMLEMGLVAKQSAATGQAVNL